MFKRLLARIVVVGGFSIAIWTGVNIFFDSTQTVIANRVLDGKPQVLTTWKSKKYWRYNYAIRDKIYYYKIR